MALFCSCSISAPFTLVPQSILMRLKDRKTILANNSRYYWPTEFAHLLEQFHDQHQQPLIPKQHLSFHLKSLPSFYDMKTDGNMLRVLGVQECMG